MNFQKFLLSLFLIISVTLSFTACNKDDNTPPDMPMGGNNDDNPNPGGGPIMPIEETGDAGTVQIFDASLIEDNLVLINDAGNNQAFLMDKSAGQGGILQFIDPDGTVTWSFEYSSEEQETHHDAELLPNGNVLAMVWEKRDSTSAVNAGSTAGIALFPDALIEVNPTTNEIVWEWHAWDHLIQDADATKENFGVVADNPHRINVNYVDNDKGDITHGNGISYDAAKDIIYLSINFFHEIWVIDHSTTTAEAAASSGGNFGKGGDLLYRFGNPEAYANTMGQRLFYNNHYPNLLTGSDAGKILVFTNGNGLDQSTVYELELPSSFNLLPNTDNEPNCTRTRYLGRYVCPMEIQ